MKQYAYLKDNFKTMQAERSNWDTMFQVLGEYVSQMKQNFQGQPSSGEFLTDTIFDSTATFAAYNSASAMLGMLWPGTAKQAIEVTPPDDMEESTELAAFYENLSKKLFRAMDDPKANLMLALDEYMLDQIIFNTSGVGVEKGYESKLLYKPYGVKELYVDEGRNGRVDKICLFYEWEAVRVVAEYGEDKVSERVRKAVEANKPEKIKILITIQKRKEKKAEKGKLAMPYESIHLEFDSCTPLREDGFHEFPIPIGRFRKLNYEKYGRGPGMAALPDIKEANALREAIIVATEKNLDPPLGVIDDGMLGGGFIDTSAGAVSIFNASNNVGGSSPIFPLVTVGSLTDALARLEDLKATISQHFNIDRLLDFNNQNEMTFGEAQIREQIRAASLVGLFLRQITEVFTPVIERSIAIMWRDGEFGVIPGSIQEQDIISQGKEPSYLPDAILKRLDDGEDVYKITYKTKAANASKAEEYMGVLDILGVAGQIAGIDPSIANRINTHEALKQLANIRGAGIIIRQDDEVEAMAQAQAQQAQQQQMLQMADQMATVGEKAANIDATMAQA
jgi:hypothetical protein